MEKDGEANAMMMESGGVKEPQRRSCRWCLGEVFCTFVHVYSVIPLRIPRFPKLGF